MKPYRIIGLSTLAMLLAAQPHSLNSQEAYDLQTCLRVGLERNYDIRIAHGEQSISQNNVTWGNAGFLPTLDATAGYNGTLNNQTHQTHRDGTTTRTNNILNQGANLGLNVSWTVFDGLQMQTNYQRLKQFAQMGELNTQIAIDDCITDLTAEYNNHVYQLLRLRNLQNAVALSRERLRIAEAKYEIGTDSRLDMLQARVDLNADSSELTKQQERVSTSGVNLNRLMALDNIAQDIRITDTHIALNTALSETHLLQALKLHNTQLHIAHQNTLVSELDYKALKGRNYPYLRLNSGYGYTINHYGTGNTKRQNNLGLTYGLTLGVNIFDGSNRRREQRNARIVIENRQLQYEQLELTLHADFTNIWIAYRNNLDLLTLEQENLASALENHQIAIERYRLGDLAGIQLREAQNSLLGAQERLLQAEFNTKLCEISLMQITGQATQYLK